MPSALVERQAGTGPHQRVVAQPVREDHALVHQHLEFAALVGERSDRQLGVEDPEREVFLRGEVEVQGALGHPARVRISPTVAEL